MSANPYAAVAATVARLHTGPDGRVRTRELAAYAARLQARAEAAAAAGDAVEVGRLNELAYVHRLAALTAAPAGRRRWWWPW